MTERDEGGRFASDDPIQRWKAAKDRENAKLVDRMLGRDPQPEPDEDTPPGPGSFDQGANLGEPTAGPRPDMNTALKEAIAEHRGGARDVTIELGADRIERYQRKEIHMLDLRYRVDFPTLPFDRVIELHRRHHGA